MSIVGLKKKVLIFKAYSLAHNGPKIYNVCAEQSLKSKVTNMLRLEIFF